MIISREASSRVNRAWFAAEATAFRHAACNSMHVERETSDLRQTGQFLQKTCCLFAAEICEEAGETPWIWQLESGTNTV